MGMAPFVKFQTEVKYLLKKCNETWRDFEVALHERRNAPNSHAGFAPLQLFVARIYRHYQKTTSLNKKIENHNFLKIAESLTLTFYRGYSQELKKGILKCIQICSRQWRYSL